MHVLISQSRCQVAKRLPAFVLFRGCYGAGGCTCAVVLCRISKNSWFLSLPLPVNPSSCPPRPINPCRSSRSLRSGHEVTVRTNCPEPMRTESRQDHTWQDGYHGKLDHVITSTNTFEPHTPLATHTHALTCFCVCFINKCVLWL